METPYLSPDETKLLEACVLAGAKAGCPQDQIERLVNVGYIPYIWQWEFHAAAREADEETGPADIGLGGARGPGKSHAVLSQVGLDDCLRVDGLKVLFLRQTGVSAQESFDDLIQKTLRGKVEYRKTKNSLRFANGSRILLGGFNDEKDIEKYIGIEYDVIIVEELTQLTEEKYNKLRGSLRTSKPNWRPRMYTSFNPGGVGHVWVRERYVLPYRANQEVGCRFIPSTYLDNPALNKGYIEYLESLGGALGKAWREGEWDLFSGQYFTDWRYEKHVVAPFKIPPTWPKFRSIDPSGRNGITSCHWYTLNSDGRLYVYKEYYYGVGVKRTDGTVITEGRDYDQHAEAIAALSKDEDGNDEDYKYTVIDTAAFAKQGYSETATEIFERKGVIGLVPAAKERVIGWNAVHFYMRYTNTQPPLLQVFKTCYNLIRTIPLLQHDDKHPEDVDTRGEDHSADELRYLVRTLREAKAPKPEKPVERLLRQRREVETQFNYNYQRTP